MATQRKLSFGSNAKVTAFGVYLKSRGMYSGGYTKCIYGIKGLFNYITLECWGDFKNMKI